MLYISDNVGSHKEGSMICLYNKHHSMWSHGPAKGSRSVALKDHAILRDSKKTF